MPVAYVLQGAGYPVLQQAHHHQIERNVDREGSGGIMEIGTEKPAIVVEPIESPVPGVELPTVPEPEIEVEEIEVEEEELIPA
jgi:hypothetical protein